MGSRLEREFYRRDVLEVAPDLLGKYLVRHWPDQTLTRYTITETEAYRGGEDLACHASRGKTKRNQVMFGDGGYVYMYLIYGIHWMLNVVTGAEEQPQAVLIRGVREASGPGRLTKLTGLDKGYYGEDLVSSNRVWIEDSGTVPDYNAGPRIGIDYAGDPWKDKPWRYMMIL